MKFPIRDAKYIRHVFILSLPSMQLASGTSLPRASS
jgi:hypothetical protein